MDKKYTKAEARKLFDVTTNYALSKAMSVTPQRLHHYADDDYLPEALQWQIRALIAEGKIAA